MGSTTFFGVLQLPKLSKSILGRHTIWYSFQEHPIATPNLTIRDGFNWNGQRWKLYYSKIYIFLTSTEERLKLLNDPLEINFEICKNCLIGLFNQYDLHFVFVIFLAMELSLLLSASFINEKAAWQLCFKRCATQK